MKINIYLKVDVIESKQKLNCGSKILIAIPKFAIIVDTIKY